MPTEPAPQIRALDINQTIVLNLKKKEKESKPDTNIWSKYLAKVDTIINYKVREGSRICADWYIDGVLYLPLATVW